MLCVEVQEAEKYVGKMQGRAQLTSIILRYDKNGTRSIRDWTVHKCSKD